MDINKILADGLKGISGTGDLIGQLAKMRNRNIITLEPGDFVRDGKVTGVPVATDLWYLSYHDNFMSHYYAESIGNTFDFSTYMGENLKCLENLTNLRPLKVLRYLNDLVPINRFDTKTGTFVNDYMSNGMFWINTVAFEFWLSDIPIQYGSTGPQGFIPNDYVGYISFPCGQLGVMEVISLFFETDVSGYRFDDEDFKIAIPVEPDQLPIMSSPSGLFPFEGTHTNRCYGKHLLEFGYVIPEESKRDTELMSAHMECYAENVRPKKWMRFWIHKESKYPVPGEFVGILCKPLVEPPHVWWFQESNPFLYAGNWLETDYFTSGVITKVTLEEDRDDDGIGNRYDIKIEGCEVTLDASDFYEYSEGDRVAVLKVDKAETSVTRSFTWNDQREVVFDSSDKGTLITNYIIIPMTFFEGES